MIELVLPKSAQGGSILPKLSATHRNVSHEKLEFIANLKAFIVADERELKRLTEVLPECIKTGDEQRMKDLLEVDDIDVKGMSFTLLNFAIRQV